jgi:hypothetical protein
LKDWRPTKWEGLFVALCGVVWLIVLAQLPPNLGGTDVYLFRDAAWNWLEGRGFATASFEHSSSFTPVLYSSYTPGTQWVFAGIGKLVGTGPGLVRVYGFLFALIADLVALCAGLRFLPAGWPRRVFLALVGISLPFGFAMPLVDRPEPVSFAVLVLLCLAMRLRVGVASAALAGLLGGLGFLCEPFAGVLAVLLIGGWLLLAGVGSGGRLGGFALQAIVAALFFVLPVAITAQAFYRLDPQSLQRFWHQATAAGVNRQANYSASDLSPAGSGAPAEAPTSTATGHPSPLKKYREALAFHRGLGPIHELALAGFAAIALVWAGLLLLARGPWQSRCALLLAGLACLVFPVVAFPLQGNYLTLTGLLLPVLLAADWASARRSLREPLVIPALLAISALATLPSSGIDVLMGWESRASHALAARQAALLQKHIEEHPLHGKVVLVPATHYYLYKDAVGNIYNPGYLSRQEDPAEVGAVVNCYAATSNFAPGTEPLPPFVAGRRWDRISIASDTVAITLFGKRVMSKNWGRGCDIYVEPETASVSADIERRQPPL